MRKLKSVSLLHMKLYFDEFKRIFPKIKVECFIRKPVSINDLARVINDELLQQDGTKNHDVQEQHGKRKKQVGS